MGAMHGQSKGFLSLSMPNTFSMGWGYIKKYKREKNLECPDRDCFIVLKERVNRMLAKGPLPGSGETIYGDVLDDTHALHGYLEFMKQTLAASLPLLDRKRGISCWAIGDVKGLNLAWAVWHHAGRKIEVESNNGVKLRYKLIAIVEDKIPDNQKVTKMWKTLVYHLEYLNEDGEVVEKLGSWESEIDAINVKKDAQEKSGLTLKIRTEKTNDKTGKATPTDRILIIAPETSNPIPFVDARDVKWNQFFTPKIKTLDDFP